MSAQRALVTGATGFIGAHLVETLVDAGVEVVALVRPTSRVPDRWHGAVTCVTCAAWSEAGLRAALASQAFEHVFHLAAYGVHPSDRDPGAMARVNVDLPAAIVHLCHERGASLVAGGTFSEYQRPAGQTVLNEQCPLERAKIYGASKAAGGVAARALAEGLGVRLRHLRFFHVYGPGEAPHRLLPSLVTGLSTGNRVALSAGTQVRDFLYVKDAVDACIKTADDLIAPGRPLTATWNVCTGAGHTVRTFAETVAEALGARTELLGFGDLPLRPDDEPYQVGDGHEIQRAIGWHAKHDLGTGILAALAALKARSQREVTGAHGPRSM
jgi:nucleoside-diphosphate-sugar epimerase